MARSVSVAWVATTHACTPRWRASSWWASSTRTSSGRRRYAEKFGCKAFATEQELLDAGVDAVSIAVPTTYHLKSAEPFLKAGVACLIEKPLAQGADEAEKIKKIAEEHDACLMVGHIERFNPIMRAMQKATETTGEPITPRFMEVHRVSPMTFRSIDIGVVMDMMIHDLDVVLMLMGGREPDEIQASGVAVVSEFEDLCNARLVWNLSEKRAAGSASRTSPPRVWR